MKVTYLGTNMVCVELTRRNLEVLLMKLDDRTSVKTIIKHDEPGTIVVKAVEDDEHYAEREPGPMRVNGEVI